MAHVAAAALGDDDELVALVGRKAGISSPAGDSMELNTLLVQLPLWGVPEHARVARLFKASRGWGSGGVGGGWGGLG